MQITKPSWKILKKWMLVKYVALRIGDKPKRGAIGVTLPDYILVQQPLLPALEKFLTQKQKDDPTLAMEATIVCSISAPDLTEAITAIHAATLTFTEEGLVRHSIR